MGLLGTTAGKEGGELGAEPGSSKGHQESILSFLKECGLKLDIYRVPGQPSRRPCPHPKKG